MTINSVDKNIIFSMIKENFNHFSTGESIWEMFDNYNLYDKGFDYQSGAVKGCILHEAFGDYVVKFCTGSFDYCEREYSNYLAAVENGLERFFPYTDYLGYLDGVDFYVQERAKCNAAEISDIWYESIRENYINYNNDDEDTVNDIIWDMIQDLEDEERAEYCFGYEAKLFDFLDKYCINDLHEGNFGYIGDRLVIIDFSGYGYKAKEREF